MKDTKVLVGRPPRRSAAQRIYYCIGVMNIIFINTICEEQWQKKQRWNKHVSRFGSLVSCYLALIMKTVVFSIYRRRTSRSMKKRQKKSHFKLMLLCEAYILPPSFSCVSHRSACRCLSYSVHCRSSSILHFTCAAWRAIFHCIIFRCTTGSETAAQLYCRHGSL